MKKFTRSSNDRKIAGVCGGLGEYFGIDPLFFRILFVIFALSGGGGILLYGIIWLLTDESSVNYNKKKDFKQTSYRDDDEWDDF